MIGAMFHLLSCEVKMNSDIASNKVPTKDHYFQNIMTIILLKVARAFIKPKGITKNSYNPAVLKPYLYLMIPNLTIYADEYC